MFNDAVRVYSKYMKSFFSILIVCFALSCTAQRQSMMFQKTWGLTAQMFFNYIVYADQLENGDYILIGGTTLNWPSAVQHYACRTDSIGNILWERVWAQDDPRNQFAMGIKLSDGTYLAVGRGYGSVSNMVASNIDQNGNILFTKYYHFDYNDFAFSVIPTNDSCFVMCGIAQTGSGTAYPAYVKIDRQGDEVWRRSQSALAGYYPTNIAQTADGGYVAVGHTGGYSNSFYAKYDSVGIMSWIKYPFGQGDTIDNDAGNIRANPDGSFDIYFKVNIPAQPYTQYGSLRHFTSQGDTISTQPYYQVANKVLLNPEDSQFYTLGGYNGYYRVRPSGGFDTLVIGNPGGTVGCIATQDGGYLSFGSYSHPQLSASLFLITKFGLDGRFESFPFLYTIKAYPNPSLDGNISLAFDVQTDETISVKVWSIDGRLVYTDEIFCPANSQTILPIHLDVGTSASGMYILETRTSTDYRRQKLVVGRAKE